MASPLLSKRRKVKWFVAITREKDVLNRSLDWDSDTRPRVPFEKDDYQAFNIIFLNISQQMQLSAPNNAGLRISGE